MKKFTGWEYLLIDAANNFGLDKQRFEERLEWANANLEKLEELAEERGQWKERPLYLKAVMAIRKAQQGIPTGHMVGFDAVCSGMQIMSVLSGCIKGAAATGLVDPDKRADAYTECTNLMSQILGVTLPNQRARVKNAVMTSLYGSKKEPKKEFGEDTPELDAFYKAMYALAPGACGVLEVTLDSWQSYALSHEWRLPDGYLAHCKVMQAKEARIEVDELFHHTFTYTYYDNEGEKKGVKNAANIIHSIDAYILRSLVRRCSYDQDIVTWAADLITTELLERSIAQRGPVELDNDSTLEYHVEQYERSSVVDLALLPHLSVSGIRSLSTEHLQGLSQILDTMLEHKPFPIVTVHDDFKCHPNNMNHLRMHYRNILAELAESTLLDDILSQIHGVPGSIGKLSNNLSSYIMQSNYALC